MDKSVAGLIGAATALAMAGPAAAAPASQQEFAAAMAVSSYGDLLRPIPNAASLLKAASMQSAPVAEAPIYDGEARIETVQYHDHHHHHHHHYRRHHRRVVVAVPLPVPHHHHHHHHHHDASVIIAPRL